MPHDRKLDDAEISTREARLNQSPIEEIPLNVILALDMSGSLDAKALENLRSAGKMLLNGLKHVRARPGYFSSANP